MRVCDGRLGEEQAMVQEDAGVAEAAPDARAGVRSWRERRGKTSASRARVCRCRARRLQPGQRKQSEADAGMEAAQGECFRTLGRRQVVQLSAAEEGGR